MNFYVIGLYLVALLKVNDRWIVWPRTEMCFIQVIFSPSECVSTHIKRIEKK
jgi:hypothetical protein